MTEIRNCFNCKYSIEETRYAKQKKFCRNAECIYEWVDNYTWCEFWEGASEINEREKSWDINSPSKKLLEEALILMRNHRDKEHAKNIELDISIWAIKKALKNEFGFYDLPLNIDYTGAPPIENEPNN